MMLTEKNLLMKGLKACIFQGSLRHLNMQLPLDFSGTGAPKSFHLLKIPASMSFINSADLTVRAAGSVGQCTGKTVFK